VTTLALADTDPADLAADAIVVGLHSRTSDDIPGALLLGGGAESIASAFRGQLVHTLALLGATGVAGEVTKLATLGTITAPLIAAVGLGPVTPQSPAVPPETLRRAAGAAVRCLAGSSRVALVLPLDGDQPGTLRAVAEGALLGAYQFADYKTRPQPGRRDPVGHVALHVGDASDETAQAELGRAATVCDAVLRTRTWVNTAPNDLRPPVFAESVADVARKAGLDVEVLDEQALKEGGYGGIIAVGQGSQAPPRLVRIGYAPEGRSGGDRPAKRVALVGKGITFDTGGISIKPAQGMWEMKSDMAGAAAVAATMLAVAALKPAVAVTAYVPIAENMPSGSAYRPGDVISMFNGKKVEVLNTDAEGRMILADALARACAEGADYVFETSTLTGGQVISLGRRIAGVMGTPALCTRVQRAGDRVGEPAWPMPLPEDVRKGMESDVADISQVNSTMDRAGHMLQGGVFLSEFVADGVPWAHIDIAGPGYHTGEPFGYWTKGGTGVPVRTLIELVEDIAANG
jgi:leucyl aminopeptidase